jgi:hypothetical protein
MNRIIPYGQPGYEIIPAGESDLVVRGSGRATPEQALVHSVNLLPEMIRAMGSVDRDRMEITLLTGEDSLLGKYFEPNAKIIVVLSKA